jgi:hypothetical protein
MLTTVPPFCVASSSALSRRPMEDYLWCSRSDAEADRELRAQLRFNLWRVLAEMAARLHAP